MKKVFILVSLLFLLLNLDASAQLKPAQSQYLVEKGVLINPSFEQGYKGWIITGCTKSLVTETPYLNKSLKLTCVNETFSIKQESTSLSDFENQQGAFDLQIKTSADGVKVASLNNSIRNTEYTQLASTTFKRYKEIGFVVDGASNGIEVYSDINFTGEIIVDDFKLGLGNLTQEISGAHFVGKLSYQKTNCQWNSTSATYDDFPVDPDCDASNIVGNVAAPDTKIPAIKIPNVRTDGEYRVKFNMTLIAGNTSASCRASISDSSTFSGQASVYNDNAARTAAMLEGSFRFDVSENKTIRLITYRVAGTASCSAYGRQDGDIGALITVHFFPDSKSTIATQDTELTAKTANEFGAEISLTGVVTGDSYDFINGNCVISDTSLYTCALNDLAIENRMICSATKQLVNRQVAYGLSSSSTEVIFRTTNISGTNTAANFGITCVKHDDDLNKSQTIVGNFEQIRSDDLALVEGAGNGSTPLTVNVTNIDFTETNDPTGSWDGSIFTAQSAGNFNFQGQVRFTANVGANLFFYKSTGGGAFVGGQIITSNNASAIQVALNGSISLNAGDRVAIRSNTAATLSNSSILHYLTITQQATKESVVANLMNSQVTKCQRKTLSANVSSIGNIADLGFSNLEIGKKYSLTYSAYDEANALTNIEHDGVVLARKYIQSLAHIITVKSGIFTATTTTVNINKQNATTSYGNGTTADSWTQLCELPETVIETTEFD